MAHTVIDWPAPSGAGGENSVFTDTSPPVGPSETGRIPAITVGKVAPPPWQPTPAAGGIDTLGSPGILQEAVGKETITGNVPGDNPVTQPPQFIGTTGFICPGYEAALYERIHLIPRDVDLGNVLTQQIFNVEVWNAFIGPQTLDSIVGGQTGVSVDSPVPPGNPPAVFPGRSSFLYQVTVNESGPASIDAEFTFDFTIESPLLSIVGTRIVAILFEPQKEIVEALDFKTDVLEAYSGKETRIRTRLRPRQLMDMEYLLIDPIERQSFRNHIIGHPGKSFAVPVWFFHRPLLQDVAQGASTIFVDTTSADFRDSTADIQSLVILYRSSSDFEIVQVAVGGLAAGQITLELPTQQAHNAINTSVVPLQVMLPKDPINWAETGEGVLRAKIKWLSEDVTDLAADDGDLTLFNGIPVLTGFNYIDTSLDESVTSGYELFDNQTGVFVALQRRDTVQLQTVKGFETQTAEDSWDLRKLLYALRGKQRSFYLPSWRSDFTAVSTIGSGDGVITVANADHSRFFDGAEPFAAIMVLLRDGTQFFRNITDIVSGPGPDQEQISIDTSLGQTVTVAEIRHISYLMKSRLGSDRIKFKHLTSGVVSVRTPVIGVVQ